MTITEQKKFIRDLIAATQKDIMEHVYDMPSEWDGIELRQYIADKFAGNVLKSTCSPARKRRFNNEVLTRNL